MGCCETRGSFLEFIPHKSEDKISELDQTTDSPTTTKHAKFDEFLYPADKTEGLTNAIISEQEDRKAHHIENYCLSLLRHKEWNLQLDTQDYIIQVKEGSIFHENLPVAVCYLDFGIHISAREIIDILYQPEIRMSWDTKIKSMKICQKPTENKSTVYYVYEFPMKNREFITKVITASQSNLTRIVYYSCDSEELPHSLSFVPANVLFGFCTIIEKSDNTMMLIAKQEDLSIGIYPGLLGNMSTQFTIWIQGFRNAVLSYHSERQKME